MMTSRATSAFFLVFLASAMAQGGSQAPAPSLPAHAKNATGKSLFVIEALLATFTRTVNSNDGTLELQSINPAATWFSEAPTKIAGRIAASDITGPAFYATEGDPSSWLGRGNFAMFSSKNNATTLATTFVFSINSAPDITDQGSTWAMNVTAIPANTDGVYAISPKSFQAKQSFGPLVTTYAPVALFVDPWCYVYDTHTGYIYYYYWCSY